MAKRTKYDCFKGAWFKIGNRKFEGRGFVVDDDELVGDFLKWQSDTARYAVYCASSGLGVWTGFFLEDDVAAVEKWIKDRDNARANKT
jgi:hypothetical protein